jgi:hypothetical protein
MFFGNFADALTILTPSRINNIFIDISLFICWNRLHETVHYLQLFFSMRVWI